MPDIPEVSFSIAQVRDLLFGCSALHKCRIVSRLVTPDFRPYIQTVEVGRKIQAIDPKAEVFQVFFPPPQPDNPTHSEIWLAHEWINSNTYYLIQKVNSQQQRQAVLIPRERITTIKRALDRKFNWMVNDARGWKIAEALATCPNKEIYVQFQIEDVWIEPTT